MKTSAVACRKAILYAAMSNAELYPTTTVVPKGMLPVFNKPLVYYPLSVAILAGIQEIALVVPADECSTYQQLLGDGARFGVRIEYFLQARSVEAGNSFLLTQEFVRGDNAMFIPADCLLYGNRLQEILAQANDGFHGITAFAHPVSNPDCHIIVGVDDDGLPISVTERPGDSRFNLAIGSVYFVDGQACTIAANLQRSTPGDVSIAEIIRVYLSQGKLRLKSFGRGIAWIETSTHAALAAAGNFIQTIESTHGYRIGCPEEVAYRMGLISSDDILNSTSLAHNDYGRYVRNLVSQG